MLVGENAGETAGASTKRELGHFPSPSNFTPRYEVEPHEIANTRPFLTNEGGNFTYST